MNKILLLTFCITYLLHAADPSKTEFAFRWNPAQGGPGTAQEALSLLGEKPKEISEYTVRYYSVRLEGYPDAILRERLESSPKAKPEYVLKFRSASPFVSLPICPKYTEGSYELDQTLLSKDSALSAFSYSCKGSDPRLISSLKAQAPRCSTRLVRYEGKKMRLEEWHLPGGKTLLELSDKEKYPKESGKKFQKALRELLARGAKGESLSKTQEAGQCP